MFSMKDLGHTLPGQIFLSVKIEHLQVIEDVKSYKSQWYACKFP